MNPNETIPEFNKKLAAALNSVSDLEGVGHIDHLEEAGFKDDLVIDGGHYNNYLLVYYLSTLLEGDQLELKIDPDKVAYLLKLLHIKEE